MLDYRLIGRIPDSIRLSRNGRPIEALRATVGDIQVRERSLWIADAALVTSVPRLPIRVDDGHYTIYAYQ